MNGIDVSHHNGFVDWSKVKAAGVEFAMIRCGYCGYDGLITKGLDSQFYANLVGCVLNSIPFGVYVYSYAANPAAARLAASEVIRLCKGNPVSFPIAIDMEERALYDVSRRFDNTRIVASFCDEIERLGAYASYYCDLDFRTNRLVAADLYFYDCWLAYWKSVDLPQDVVPHGIWQHSNKGAVDGIIGNVDLNISYKDYPSIIAKMADKGAVVNDRFSRLIFELREVISRYES